jgi:hypothetical protein
VEAAHASGSAGAEIVLQSKFGENLTRFLG